MGPFEVALVIVLWLVPTYVAYQVGKSKGRGRAWGLLLGWIGVLAVALLPARPSGLRA